MNIVRFVILILGGLAGSAQAHDLWLEAEGDVFVLRLGHDPGQGPGHGGGETVAYAPEAAGTAICADLSGRIRRLPPEGGHPARYRGDCTALIVPFTTGYWTKTAWGTVNRPEGTQRGAVDSWRSEERVKRMTSWSEALARPLAQGLEIVPVRDPFGAGSGDKLRLLVTLDGQPAAGAAVSYHGRPRGVSGPDGRVNVRVRHPGRQVVSATLETPLEDGQARRLVRTAVLQLEPPPR
jgi:nickel transport protein